MSHYIAGRNQIQVKAEGQGRDFDSAQPTAEDFFAQKPQLLQYGSNLNRVFVKLEIGSNVFSPENNPEARIKITYQAYQSNGLKDLNLSLVSQRSVYVPAGSRYMELDVYSAGRSRNVYVKLFVNFENSKWYKGQTIELSPLSLKTR